MILNRQRTVRVARPALELFLRRVREQLGLATADVTVCLVSDAEIARLNQSFRKKKGPTDVLSFPVTTRRGPRAGPRPSSGKRASVAAADYLPRASRGGGHFSFASGMSNASLLHADGVSAVPRRAEGARVLAPEAGGDFLGDIAISPATARRNAKKFHRALPSELQILILHGVLHLLGYDHETDRGQMTRIENRLRRRFGLS
jgi:rRNA maturation RNase YbeY